MAIDLPPITDEAIERVCRILDLPLTAFSGVDGLDPRLSVLKSLDEVDVEACPGSGKTTLLVAKLAILARMWTENRSGLCVLSHTNVARHEIEKRLGNTPEGRRLLSYPHFIGTIHGFANEFLSIPWLRSSGYKIEAIDDEMALNKRWWKLNYSVRRSLQNSNPNIEPSKLQNYLRIIDTNFSLGTIPWGRNSLGPNSASYQEIANACRESINEGYFCHSEMFIWAHDLLEKHPDTPALLRARFPLIFIDEVQDNSEEQSRILHRIFSNGTNLSVRQRYGDANQAIFQYSGQDAGATTDPFPATSVSADIPNSFRFNQAIANFADPLALAPQGLIGCRAPKNQEEVDCSDKHAIFLFDDQTIGHVLSSYGTYLLNIFSAQEIKEGNFTAIGAVHRPEKDDHCPRHVKHYWPDYDAEINRADPQPQTFLQYLGAGYRLSERSKSSYPVVEKIAEAIFRLARISDATLSTGTRKRKHRHILEIISDHDENKLCYLDFIRAFAIEREPLGETDWNDNWIPQIKLIVAAITGTPVDSSNSRVTAFLSWNADPSTGGPDERTSQKDNVFRYPKDAPAVSIRVGSIHAAKGETHTATLVLETFSRVHQLKKLKPWLLGNRSGSGRTTPSDQSRLKQHYVAMTRPARLLCLALREDALSESEITTLRDRGWRVATVGEAGPVWKE